MDDDWSLVVSSFQTQYGIRLSSDLSGMSWREFSYYLQGLSGETPLGRIIAIRGEKDPEVLKHFTPEQKKIRAEYLTKAAKEKSQKEINTALEDIKAALLKMAQ